MKELATEFTINNIVVCTESRQLSFNNKTVNVEPKAMKLLRLLASKPGNVVSLDELRAIVWNDVYVCRHAIYRTISHLRKVFRALDPENKYIETISKGGYKLLGELSYQSDMSHAMSTSTPTQVWRIEPNYINTYF